MQHRHTIIILSLLKWDCSAGSGMRMKAEVGDQNVGWITNCWYLDYTPYLLTIVKYFSCCYNSHFFHFRLMSKECIYSVLWICVEKLERRSIWYDLFRTFIALYIILINMHPMYAYKVIILQIVLIYSTCRLTGLCQGKLGNVVDRYNLVQYVISDLTSILWKSSIRVVYTLPLCRQVQRNHDSVTYELKVSWD